ncbi:MAG: hypothetical protein RLZ64_1553 [Pseudomonadota bacterium]
MSPLGNPHSRDHANILAMIYLFAGIQDFDLDVHDNCTFRKAGYAEVQPDVAVYVDDRSEVIPWDTVIIDLEQYPAPDLAIEVSASSLADDQGPKRLLTRPTTRLAVWSLTGPTKKITRSFNKRE